VGVALYSRSQYNHVSVALEEFPLCEVTVGPIKNFLKSKNYLMAGWLAGWLAD
jgi:hypothetical protein